ncbi:hypothetical protein MVEG_03054 [Podila verticillata NRRL 6337]|nr:MAG: hypothetical protein BYD32DRAFT_423134 [Podila humilis]KFH72765.1 hypothetical protein MVEG_03054 [Podila verticillata NRRL 6337]
MSDPARVSQYYRKKLEQHELTPEEWVAVRYAVIKHTAIAAATTVTLGSAGFFYARSRSLSKVQSLLIATAGNVIGLSVGGAIAMESGMKTVEQKLQGSGSELLYLMDRYSKATLREKLGDKDDLASCSSPSEKHVSPRMIGVQDSEERQS